MIKDLAKLVSKLTDGQDILDIYYFYFLFVE